MSENIQLNYKKVLVFGLDENEYAIEIDVVQGIERLMNITRVPRTPSFVKGVINLRGVVTPVIDLRARFQLPLRTDDEQSRIVIVSMEQFDVGLIVDTANDIIDVPRERIESQPEVVGSIASEFIAGIAKVDGRLLSLLDLPKVLTPIHELEASR
ncbi:MAG TPA: chemotaxis protein CheW [Sporosarcina sp.]|nr:chemotaxis protein CheW [Sporosarcina sp.]